MIRNNNHKIPIIILAGATASGKSTLAMEFAHQHHAVIINGDSMQLYQDLSIITARPSYEDEATLPHRLYGILPYHVSADVGYWLDIVHKEIVATYHAGKLPLICGGSGLYMQALYEGISNIPNIDDTVKHHYQTKFSNQETTILYQQLQSHDPYAAKKINQHDRQRITRALMIILEYGKSLYDFHRERVIPHNYQYYCYWLDHDRDSLYKKINHRVDIMLHNGAVEEVKSLLNKCPDEKYGIMQAIGVKEITAMVQGHMSYDTMSDKIKTNTRRYAKRQMTFQRTQLSQFTFIKTPKDMTYS